MFLRDILFICVLLHFSPNLYRCVESVLVIKPQNVAAKSGEVITLSCSTDAGSKGKIEWSAFNRESSKMETIYDGQASDPKFSSYISVSDRDDGTCSLNITASVTAAKRYMCTDRLVGVSAIAELILLEKNTTCTSETTDGSVHVSCSLVYAGNWAPVVECKQWNKSRIADIPGNVINTSVDNVVMLTWNYISDNEEFQIFCVTAFKESERPKETSATSTKATNVPKYFDEIVIAYIGKPACSKYQCAGWIVAFSLSIGVSIGVSAALAIKLVTDWRKKEKNETPQPTSTTTLTCCHRHTVSYPTAAQSPTSCRKKESSENRNTGAEDPPGKPGEPECTGTTKDSVTLSWEPPLRDEGIPVKAYVVEMREKGPKLCEWLIVSTTVTVTTFTVKELTEGRRYEFRVAAVNDAGQGEFGKASSEMMPKDVSRVLLTMPAQNDTAGTLVDAFMDVNYLSRFFTVFKAIDIGKLVLVIKDLGLSWQQIPKVKELKPGDHICYPLDFVKGGLAYHHAIVKRVLDDGEVEVIQHSGRPDEELNKFLNTIRNDQKNLNTLASDGRLYRINYKKCDPADKVIATAEGELGKAGLHDQRYNVFYNNCEHFATWCKIGKAFSQQSGYVQPKQPSILDQLFPWATIFRE